MDGDMNKDSGDMFVSLYLQFLADDDDERFSVVPQLSHLLFCQMEFNITMSNRSSVILNAGMYKVEDN